MAIKEFKTESKRLLDLMANSIYTNTDIFLRELISNASDAIDKRNFLSLQNENIQKVDGEINLTLNKEERTIVISDNGIGMNKEDLENNLGTIAKSGSYDFKQNIDEKDEKYTLSPAHVHGCRNGISNGELWCKRNRKPGRKLALHPGL